jgi:hypothetical protein
VRSKTSEESRSSADELRTCTLKQPTILVDTGGILSVNELGPQVKIDRIGVVSVIPAQVV